MSLVACCRTVQSAAHIGQWLEFHLAVGFTHIHFLLDNKTTDETERVLASYVERGVADVERTRFRDRDDSTRALQRCVLRVFAHANERTWFMTLDDDELLVPPLAEQNGVQHELERVEREHGGALSHWVPRVAFSPQGGPCTSEAGHFWDRFRLHGSPGKQCGTGCSPAMLTTEHHFPKMLFQPRAILRRGGNPSQLECALAPHYSNIGDLRHGPGRCLGRKNIRFFTELKLNHYTLNMTWRMLTHTSERETAFHLSHAERRYPTDLLDNSMSRFLPLVSSASRDHSFVTLRLTLSGGLGNQLWECAVAFSIRKRLELFGHTVNLELIIGRTTKHPSILDSSVWKALPGHLCEGGRQAAPDAQEDRVTIPISPLKQSWLWACRPENCVVSPNTTLEVKVNDAIGQWDSIASVATEMRGMDFSNCGTVAPASDEIVLHMRNFTREFPHKTLALKNSHFRELPPHELISAFLSSPDDEWRPVAVVGSSAAGMVAALRQSSPKRQVRLISQTPLQDLCFMAKTKHRLIVQAKSSFAWWAAFLSGADRVDAWAVALDETHQNKPGVGRLWNPRESIPTGYAARNLEFSIAGPRALASSASCSGPSHFPI